MKENNITVNDLVLNPSFKKWVLTNGKEEKHWRVWCEGNLQFKDEIEEAKHIVKSMSKHQSLISRDDINEEWSRLESQLDGEVYLYGKTAGRSDKFNLVYFLSIAASILLLIGLFLFIQYQYDPTTQLTDIQQIEKSSLTGQKLTIQLEDGTIVKLNAESTLKYSEQFDGDTREVYLKGEAFFDVAENPDKPFIIHTENITTRVLGTSFNVSAYPDDNKIQVVVKTGKVSVEKTDHNKISEKAILSPMEMVTYHHSDKMVKERVDNPDFYLSWKDNVIYFHQAQWPEIKKKLERWYGKNIHVSGVPDVNNGYNGTFEDLSLESVLDRIGYSLNFKYEFSEDYKDVFIIFNNKK